MLHFSAAQRDDAATSAPALPGPLKALFGFERVRDLAPGAAVNVTIAAPAAGAHLSTVMPHDGSRRLLPGRWRVQIGVRSADVAVLEHDIELVGTGVTTEGFEPTRSAKRSLFWYRVMRNAADDWSDRGRLVFVVLYKSRVKVPESKKGVNQRNGTD